MIVYVISKQENMMTASWVRMRRSQELVQYEGAIDRPPPTRRTRARLHTLTTAVNGATDPLNRMLRLSASLEIDAGIVGNVFFCQCNFCTFSLCT